MMFSTSIPSSGLSYSTVLDSQLSPSEFLDRAILLLAARHGANPENNNAGDNEDEDQQQSSRWQEVSKDMMALAKSSSCRSGQLKITSTMVDDAEAFSPKACINRAQFALYRLKKEEEERKEAAEEKERQRKITKASQQDILKNQYVDPRDPKPSGFDITKKGHSIADAVSKIMEECRSKIMNISVQNNNNNQKSGNNNNDDNDNSSDDDDTTPIEIYKPPAHIAKSLMMSEEETKRALEIGQAEEDLINRVHKLQMDHFTKYKKWINLTGNGEESSSLPLLASDVSTGTKSALMEEKTPNNKKNSNKNSSSLPSLHKFSADDVAELLGKLNLGEHISRFRRTTGPLLAGMSKDDVRLRFDNDHEATDILWMHIEEKMNREKPPVQQQNEDDENDSSHHYYYSPTNKNSSSSASARPRLSAGLPPSSNNTAAALRSNINNMTRSRESSQMKAIYDAISAPSEDFALSQQELDDFEGNGEEESSSSASSLREQLRQGNFHALKRTLDILEGNGSSSEENSDDNKRQQQAISAASSSSGVGRPLRPSQEYKMMRGMSNNNNGKNEDEDASDLNELTDSYMNRLSSVNSNNNNKNNSTSSSKSDQEVLLSKKRQENNYGRGGGGVASSGRGGRGGGGRGAAAVVESAPVVAPTTAASSSRSGRWAIMEYDEDEDDVE